MALKKEKYNSIAVVFLQSLKVGFVLLFLFNSYNSFSQMSFKERNKFYKELKFNAKENNDEVFVITKDNVKHSGKKFKFPPAYFATSNFIKIDDVKYDRKQRENIIAWQDDESYNVYHKNAEYDAVRYVKGKVNLYQYVITPANFGSKIPTSYIYFLLEKEKFEFIDATSENIEAVFSDNKLVINKFHELYPEAVRKKTKYPNQNKHTDEYAWIENIVMLTQLYNK